MRSGLQESLALSREGPRVELAAPWHAYLATLDPCEKADEQAAITAAQRYTEHLKACRDERYALSLLPPGRLLSARRSRRVTGTDIRAARS